MRHFARLAGLILIAAVSTAASCAPVTLRQAQESFNLGTESMSALPRKSPFENSLTPADSLRLPETHFQKALELIQKGELVDDTSQPPHLRYAALLLKAYSEYSLYRLTPPQNPDAVTHREAAAGIIDSKAGPAMFQTLFGTIAPEKKGIVRRESGLFLTLSLLIRAEDHLRSYEQHLSDRKEMTRVFNLYVATLDSGVALEGKADMDSVTDVPAASPIAEYLALVMSDIAEAAFGALEKSDIPPATPAQKKAADDIARSFGKSAAWILKQPHPVTLASLKDAWPRLYERSKALQAIADRLFGSGIVTELPH